MTEEWMQYQGFEGAGGEELEGSFHRAVDA